MIKKIIVISFFFIVGCHPIDDRLTIINNTNQTVIIGDRLWSKNQSVYLNNKTPIDNFDFEVNQIQPKSEMKMITRGNWEDSFINNDTMVILVFNKNSILKKRIEKPSDNYDINQIIYVSRNFIEKNNWKINIDSTNNSKTIRY